MKSNIKRLSLCLSMLMLMILASPLTVLAAEEEAAASTKFYGTFWSLVPPIVAIALALITKEVYSSLFVGILVGALFYSNFSFEGTILHIFEGGIDQCTDKLLQYGNPYFPGYSGNNGVSDEQSRRFCSIRTLGK